MRNFATNFNKNRYKRQIKMIKNLKMYQKVKMKATVIVNNIKVNLDKRGSSNNQGDIMILRKKFPFQD